jgi:mRNA-degrading endonuclease HigB of HigAB toxin-antitoxin module
MDIFSLAVKRNNSQNGSVEMVMRLLGHTEVGDFIAQNPEQAEAVRAWLAEVRHRQWTGPATLAADFLHVDASDPPVVIFRLLPVGVRIETLVDFRNGVVLLTAIQRQPMIAPYMSANRNTHRGH